MACPCWALRPSTQQRSGGYPAGLPQCPGAQAARRQALELGAAAALRQGAQQGQALLCRESCARVCVRVRVRVCVCARTRTHMLLWWEEQQQSAGLLQ